MIEAARRREIDVVVVWRLDRWGRSVTDLPATLQERQTIRPTRYSSSALPSGTANVSRWYQQIRVCKAAKDWAYLGETHIATPAEKRTQMTLNEQPHEIQVQNSDSETLLVTPMGKIYTDLRRTQLWGKRVITM